METEEALLSESMGKPFALYGCEKMIYDIRMGPQALCLNNVIYFAYQANPNGPEAHPHLITYDLGSEKWSDPVRAGSVEHYDHHFAPIIWFDRERRIHVLYNCHVRDGGIHLVSAAPESLPESPEDWIKGSEIAPSISYPRVIRLDDATLMLYYRVFGHMGYWSYLISRDGGNSWTPPDAPVVDFDRDPQDDSDTWAGSYHSVHADEDGRSLHIAFIYWDERKKVHPIYNRSLRTTDRYHLYYLRLDIPSGALYTIDGERLEAPVTRRKADKCKVWDTGHRLTNMPSIAVDDGGEPCFMVPVSGETPWECEFYFVRREGGEWTWQPVTQTNHTWAGSNLTRRNGSTMTAHLVVGGIDGETLSYGGGEVEEWVTTDGGSSWSPKRRLVPVPGLMYNNPRPVELANGGELADFLLFYGWQGPESIQPPAPGGLPPRNRGQAFLSHDGKWL
jgi:hypothetical protein